MLLRILAVAVLGSAACSAQAPAHTTCELFRNPDAFNGKLVTVRGIDSSTDEGIWLKDANCPGVELGGTRWPAMLWIATPLMSRDPFDFEFDEPSWTRVMAEYRQKWRGLPDQCVEFTYTGIFRTRTNWEDWKTTFPDGRVMYLGFGHANAAPGELVVKSADRVGPIKNCK